MLSPGQTQVAIGALAVLLTGTAGADPRTEPGVSRALAAERARLISNLRYTLHLTLPESAEVPIQGREVVHCRWAGKTEPMVFDFHAPPESVGSVRVNGRELSPTWKHDHLLIPPEALAPGPVEVEITFVAGNGSLNRNQDFLYTLFVPDRARFAFPCFDQPDLRARFELTLDIPAAWEAVANAPERERTSSGDRTQIHFSETLPLPTYLFAFAAGRFEIEEATQNGRTMRMFHRETDADKLARNRDTIFEAHARSLAWMETYADIPYPFPKFDFVLIPSFQYGGMEHPGAILYRAETLLLETSATPLDQLRQANLIAHETSHMWFGDLVTLAWFDDVWTKEVFAGFLASRMVDPMFPAINHDLRFLLSNLPAAYAIDRTAGTHPIAQPLDNLKDAGSLYGSVIYHKAPVLMRQLERRIGPDRLQEGLRKYLSAHAFGSASWADLIAILDELTPEDLSEWNQAWVKEAGRPEITATWQSPPEGSPVRVTVTQSDPAGRGRVWPQDLDVIVGDGERTEEHRLQLRGASATFSGSSEMPTPAFVLPPGGGPAYGLFRLDPSSREYLLESVGELKDPVLRGVVWLSLWDGMLEGDIPPKQFLARLVEALEQEQDPLLVDRLLAYTRGVFWRYLPAIARPQVSEQLGSRLWAWTQAASDPARKAMYLRAYRSMALAPADVERLKKLWQGALVLEGLPLAETDQVALARELAVRGVAGWAAILDAQEKRITNPDRRSAFQFVRPFLDADSEVRAASFARLAERSQRARERWVIEGLGWLHHPLRAETSRRHLRPSLDLLKEIQTTGDIFFPKAWLDASFSGHQSREAAAIVRSFLKEHPDYPAPLRAKILQSTDGLFRASRQSAKIIE